MTQCAGRHFETRLMSQFYWDTLKEPLWCEDSGTCFKSSKSLALFEKKNGFYGRCCFFWDFFLLHQLHEILAPGLKLIFHTTSFDRSHHILYMYYTDVWPHRGFSNFQRRTQGLEIHFQGLEPFSMTNWCLKATSFAGRDSIFPALKHRLKLANRFSMQHPGAHTVTKLPATKDKTAAGLCLLGSYQTWTSPQVR